jgi:hypothetical protein
MKKNLTRVFAVLGLGGFAITAVRVAPILWAPHPLECTILLLALLYLSLDFVMLAITGEGRDQ